MNIMTIDLDAKRMQSRGGGNYCVLLLRYYYCLLARNERVVSALDRPSLHVASPARAYVYACAQVVADSQLC